MKGKWGAVLRFWREYVFKYRGAWGLAFVLQLSFFTISAILPFLFKRVIDALTATDLALFAFWIMVYIGTEITQAFLLYSRGYAMRRLELRVEQDLQLALYRKYHIAPYARVIQTKTGEALQRLTSDVPLTSPLIIKSFSELIGHLVLVAIVLALMFVMAPLLAGISIAFVVIYAIGYRSYSKRSPIFAARRQEAQARYIAVAEEGLEALYSVRVQAGLRGAMRNFSQALASYLKEAFALYKLNLLFQGGFTTFITLLSGAAVMVVGGWLIFRGAATVGTLVAFTQYVHWLYVFVSFMSDFATEVEPALVSLQRVQEVLAWPEEWVVEAAVPPKAVPDHPYAVEIRDLDFALGGISIFHGLNLKIERGKVTAVVGRSGVGKSTLLNLILGLYPVPPGKLYLFGQDSTSIPLPERLGLVAVVEQEPRFFSGDLETSLQLGSASREAIESVAERLGMEGFIKDLLARKLSSSKLSELSGGERKRLGILRGFLRDAPLVLLDEPTAFLDEATALQIMEKIRANFAGRTIVVFTHDPLIQRYCDAWVNLEAMRA